MVIITDYKTYQKEDGTEFHALIVQGGIEVVKSNITQRNYFTARTAKVPCTFNEFTCESLKGTELPGSIKRVEVEPYQFTNSDTGEEMTLSHRNMYIDENETIVHEQVVPETVQVI
jgi:hypothetical protein